MMGTITWRTWRSIRILPAGGGSAFYQHHKSRLDLVPKDVKVRSFFSLRLNVILLRSLCEENSCSFPLISRLAHSLYGIAAYCGRFYILLKICFSKLLLSLEELSLINHFEGLISAVVVQYKELMQVNFSEKLFCDKIGFIFSGL